MTVEKALREVLQINEQLKQLEKLAAAPPTPSRSSAEQREQQVAQQAEELTQRVNNIFVVDSNERMQVKSLQDRVLGQLSKFLQSEPKVL